MTRNSQLQDTLEVDGQDIGSIDQPTREGAESDPPASRVPDRTMPRRAAAADSAERVKTASQQYTSENAAIMAKKARLRALRLAKEAETDSKVKVRKKKGQ